MLEVTFSHAGMPRFQIQPCDERTRNIIRAAVTCQYTNDERYKLASQAGAFLQGFSEDHGGWVLVEFWKEDYQPFVELLNRLLEESKESRA